MNPIVELRQERGEDRASFAALLDVDYHVLARLELGYCRKIPGPVWDGLLALCYSVDEIMHLEQGFREWRRNIGPTQARRVHPGRSLEHPTPQNVSA